MPIVRSGSAFQSQTVITCLLLRLGTPVLLQDSLLVWSPFSGQESPSVCSCSSLTFSRFFSSMGHAVEVTNASSPRHFSRQNSHGSQVIATSGEPPDHTIDCGDTVWALAFGSSVPEKQSRCVNIEWHRFTFGQDQLLLATGLNNGRIKIWDVYTGEQRDVSHFGLTGWSLVM